MYANLPISKIMVVRTIIFFLAWLNQMLVVKGHSPLPFDDTQTEFIVSSVITFIASMWTWWKNNSFTKKARKADKIIENEAKLN